MSQITIQSDRFGQGPYLVTLNAEGKAVACTCPARGKCKHLERAENRESFRKAAAYFIKSGKFGDQAEFLAAFEDLVTSFEEGERALEDGGNKNPLNQAIRLVIQRARAHWKQTHKAKACKKAPAAPSKGDCGCHRCGGKGVIQAFMHVQGGVCFRCNGSGVDPKANN